MLTDQAQALRDMVASDAPDASPAEPRVHARERARQVLAGAPLPSGRIRTRTRVLAVSSGKGGVGKTNVAVNLAIRLSQMGRKTVLIDADLGTANADVLCNLTPTCGLAHVVAGRKSISDARIAAPGGFTLIPGASGLAQIANLSDTERDRLLRQLRTIDQSADLIIIDTGAGVGPNVLSFLAASDQQLIVTTPEPTAITDAYAVIKTLCRAGGGNDLHLLVNMAGSKSEGRAVYDRVAAVCERFLKVKLSYAGLILNDASVVMAVRQRHPFVLSYPQSSPTRNINELAHRLDRFATEPANQNFWQRLTGWMSR